MQASYGRTSLIKFTLLENEIIYIELLNEGTNVWRPMEAQKIKENVYEIRFTPSHDPEDEELKYKVGEVVICERKKLSGEFVLVAINSA